MTQTVSSVLAWRRLPRLGVEIDHDQSQPLTVEQGDQLVRLLWEHGLVLARGQRLTMERQRELCALAGPVLIRAGESGYLTTSPKVETSQAELSWRADAAYTHAPFDVLALHAIALQHSHGSLKACGKRVLQRVVVGREGVAPRISMR